MHLNGFVGGIKRRFGCTLYIFLIFNNQKKTKFPFFILFISYQFFKPKKQ